MGQEVISKPANKRAEMGDSNLPRARSEPTLCSVICIRGSSCGGLSGNVDQLAIQAMSMCMMDTSTHLVACSYEIFGKDLSCLVRVADIFKSFSGVSSSFSEEDLVAAGMLEGRELDVSCWLQRERRHADAGQILPNALFAVLGKRSGGVKICPSSLTSSINGAMA